MATLQEVTFILERVGAAYSVTVEKETARAYHTVLGRYPRLVLVQATTQLMESNKWFPKPSEIAEVAYQVNSRYKVTEGDEFDEAAFWTMFVQNYTSTDELTSDDIDKVYRRMLNAPAWCVQAVTK